MFSVVLQVNHGTADFSYTHTTPFHPDYGLGGTNRIETNYAGLKPVYPLSSLFSFLALFGFSFLACFRFLVLVGLSLFK